MKSYGQILESVDPKTDSNIHLVCNSASDIVTALALDYLWRREGISVIGRSVEQEYIRVYLCGMDNECIWKKENT